MRKRLVQDCVRAEPQGHRTADAVVSSGGENGCEVWSGVSTRFGREVIIDASGGGRSIIDVERNVAANCFNGCEGWEQVSFGIKL